MAQGSFVKSTKKVANKTQKILKKKKQQRENQKGAVARNAKSKLNDCDTGFAARMTTKKIDKKNETSAAARAMMGGGGNFHFSDLKQNADKEVARRNKEKAAKNSAKSQMKNRLMEQIKDLGVKG